MNKHANIRTFTLIGIIANSCFILFILLGFLYYWFWANFGTRSTVADIGIYPFEVFGFMLLAVYTISYVLSLYGHRLLKTMMIVYFLAELLLIIFDLGAVSIAAYNNSSWILISLNLLLCIAVCLSYRALAPINIRFVRAVTIAAAAIPVCFAALGFLFSFKVYFTVLSGSISFLYLNIYMYIQMNRGNLEFETRQLFSDK